MHDPETGYSLGNICHISGFDPNHHRFNSEMTNEERRKYNNLIALCPTHHSLIDNSDEGKGFTIEYLRELKKQHELGLSNDIVRYVNSPRRRKISKKLAVISGLISVPLSILCKIFEKRLFIGTNVFIVVSTVIILVPFLLILLYVYITYLFSKNESYLFFGLFTKRDENENLVIYRKFANCTYCNSGRVFLEREEINNNNLKKIIGTCNSCMSKYTFEKNDIGRRIPYNIINAKSS